MIEFAQARAEAGGFGCASRPAAGSGDVFSTRRIPRPYARIPPTTRVDRRLVVAADPPALPALPGGPIPRHAGHRLAVGRDRLGGLRDRPADHVARGGRLHRRDDRPGPVPPADRADAHRGRDRRSVRPPPDHHLLLPDAVPDGRGAGDQFNAGRRFAADLRPRRPFRLRRAFFQPTASALGPMLVPLHLLPRAIATNSLAAQLASILGPASAGCSVSSRRPSATRSPPASMRPPRPVP